MFPPPFDYHAPATLEEAVALLARHPDEAKVLSGGQSLLPLMKLRLGQPAHLVDIGRIPGLEYVEERDGVLAIGGRTREAALERAEVVRARYPLLADTAAVIADNFPAVMRVAIGFLLRRVDVSRAMARRGSIPAWHATHLLLQPGNGRASRRMTLLEQARQRLRPSWKWFHHPIGPHPEQGSEGCEGLLVVQPFHVAPRTLLDCNRAIAHAA